MKHQVLLVTSLEPWLEAARSQHDCRLGGGGTLKELTAGTQAQ